MKKLRVTIEGRTYEVLVEVLDQDCAPAAAPAAPPAVASAPVLETAAFPVASAAKTASTVTVVSPLAGKIVSIDVKLGQTVEEGTQIATIEAMKMNTFIYASKAGRIDEVLANAGDAVDEGAALMRLV